MFRNFTHHFAGKDKRRSDQIFEFITFETEKKCNCDFCCKPINKGERCFSLVLTTRNVTAHLDCLQKLADVVAKNDGKDDDERNKRRQLLEGYAVAGKKQAETVKLLFAEIIKTLKEQKQGFKTKTGAYDLTISKNGSRLKLRVDRDRVYNFTSLSGGPRTAIQCSDPDFTKKVVEYVLAEFASQDSQS